MRKYVKYSMIILLLLSVGIAAVCVVYLFLFAPGDSDLSGEWIAELEMTGQAAAMAYGWLKDMEGVSVSLEDVEAHMQDLTVRVNLTMEQTKGPEGIFRCIVLPESYEACNQAAYEAFAVVFRELAAERLRMAGYEGSTEQEAVEALIAETFGMSAVSYLMTCGPALLPSLEMLQAQYNGSGTYETMEGVLIRQFEAEGSEVIREERYIREDSQLVLVEERGAAASGCQYPLLYKLKQERDQENSTEK